jgi:DHA2 family methylenomycin A resistance protein-like MFS transporter
MTGAARPRAPKARQGALLTVLVVAQTLGIANANLIVVALPPLSADLGASAPQQQWVVEAYVLVLAAGLVLSGALADRWGSRRLLLAGLSTFAIASLVCALAQSPALLIAFRALQAVGPAMVLPASLTIVARSFPPGAERARAFGIWGGASGLGVALGPLIGGVMVTAFGWRWAFAFNVPSALLLLCLAARIIDADPRTRVEHRLDWTGAALVTGAMAALVFAIIQGPHDGWLSDPVVGVGALSAALLVAFVRAERRHPRPLVDLSLVVHRPLLASNLAAAAVVFAELGASVCLSTFLQTYRGQSPLEAGLSLLPLGVGIALLAVLGGRLAQRIPARRQITTGLLLSLLGTLLLSRADADAGPAALLPGLLALGAGVGFALPAGTAAAANVPATRTGMASAIHNASRQVGGTLGVAVMGSVVITQSAAGTANAYADGLRAAMLSAAACLILAIAGLLALTRTTGARPCAP